MNDFAEILHSTPPADPASPVLVPGEIEMRNLVRQRREGVAVDSEMLAKLEAYAARGM
jgi:LDH2 family malate/lactate/ureidoglycolate dehydrogenase